MSQPSSWPLPAGSSRVVLPAELTQQLAQHPLSRDLYPIAFGHYVQAKGHHITRPHHTDYLLIFCHEGAGDVVTASYHGRLQTGDLLLLPRGIAHTYQADTQQPWSIYWCHFNGAAAPALMDFLGLQPQQLTLSLQRWQALLPDVTALLNLQQHRLTLANMLQAAALLRKICVQLPLLTKQSKAASAFDPAQLLRFLTDNLHRSLSLADMAAVTGLSTYHFSKKFRAHTGTSPTKFFNELKVQHACRLLDNTTLSIRHIAQAVGIDDAYYFSRLFKKTMGVAPQLYRDSRHGIQQLGT